MSVNQTYKNLEAPMRVFGLTIPQWLLLIAASAAAFAFARWLSPLPAGPTLSIAVMIAGFPLATSYALAGAEFSGTALVAAVWRWRRRPRRYGAGPGSASQGFVVEPSSDRIDARAFNGNADLDLEALWEL
jgi:hypothetical protein